MAKTKETNRKTTGGTTTTGGATKSKATIKRRTGLSNKYLSRTGKHMKKVVLEEAQRQNLVKESLAAVKLMTELSQKSLVKTVEGRAGLMAEPQAPILTSEMVEAMSADFMSNKQNLMRMNTVASVGVDNVISDRMVTQEINYAYSHEMDRVPRATTQEHSGRCWLFAALNSIRAHMIQAYNLPDHFEISEAYLFFWDKLERAYCILTTLARLRTMDMTEPLYQHILRNNSPSQDGGNWGQVVNLIQKYGLVPKTVYGESFNSSYSDEMNELVHSRLLVFNQYIRGNAGLSDEELTNVIVTQMMPDIFQLVATCLGRPPMPTESFTWQYNESSDNFESVRQKGQYHCLPGLTPLSFYETLVAPYYNIENKVFISDDPRMPTGQTYAVEYGDCMVGGMPDVTLNVGIEEMRRAVATSVMEKQPVWFACDVGKDFDPYSSILSTNAFKAEEYFGQKLKLEKAQALNSLSSFPTHAMSFVGLNTTDEDPEQVDKWKVENSWGAWTELNDPGYLQMDDDWFRKYVFTAVVDISCLSPELQTLYKEQKYNPVKLPYNDPFGSVACRL